MKLLLISIAFLFSAPLFAMEAAPKPKDLSPKFLARLSVAGKIDGQVFASCYTPDSSHIAIGGLDYYPSTLGIWETTDYTNPRLKLPARDGILVLAANPNNNELANSGSNIISFWDIITGVHNFTNINPEGYIQSIEYNNDGSLLLIGNDNGTCKIWDLRSKTCAAILEGGNRPLWSAKWSPDNTHVATSSADMTTRFFDVRTTKLINSLDLQIPLGEVAYNSTGKQLAIAAAYQILLCDTQTGEISDKYTLKGKKIPKNTVIPAKLDHLHMADPIQYVPGYDDVLIAGLLNGNVTIVDLQDDEKSIEFKSSSDFKGIDPHNGHHNISPSPISTISISPDAKTFVAGTLLTDTNVWDLEQFLENRKAKLQPEAQAVRNCRLQ